MKKKILFQSDFSLGKTGFGRNARALLTHLYKTDKYELVHYCCGVPWSDPSLQRTPWKSVGALPDSPNERDQLNRDPNMARRASYGEYNLDKIIEQEKPDVYIACQDIWGVDFAIKKPWFEKIHSVIWTTLDSLPILPTAIEAAKKTENYWVWSDFATKALHNLGHKQVKTVHGIVDTSLFKKLPTKKQLDLRKAFIIDEDEYIIGFVFRNQLRKSVPNLLEGFSKLLKRNQSLKAKLLLHTHFGEGWGIMDLAKEYGIPEDKILTTYVCRKCHNYIVHRFIGVEVSCPLCKTEGAMTTTNVNAGVTEAQLNEVYNIMDVYCHPFTSGGQEIPIQEAKLAELITLVTNYSCGEEMCKDEAASLPLKWSEYREHGTQFIKASTDPNSIANQLEKVLKMSEDKKKKQGEKAREWVKDNFSAEVIGGFFEEFVDSLPNCDFDFKIQTPNHNPNYSMPQIEDDGEWLKHMYEHILQMKNITDEDEGLKYWLNEISKGASKESIEKYFRDVASKQKKEEGKAPFEEELDKDDDGRRMLYIMPESIGDVFVSTALFESLKSTYPDYNLYVATSPEYFSVLDGNEHVHKVIPYAPQLDNFTFTEGHGKHNGYFEVAFSPHFSTQKMVNYVHNGKDIIPFNIKGEECPTY